MSSRFEGSSDPRGSVSHDATRNRSASSGASAEADTGPRVAGGAAVRALWLSAGLVCSFVGLVGVILPGLPGVIFLIMAAACFARSSPRLEERLLKHPKTGPAIVAWRRTGAVPRRAKIIAGLSMLGSLGLIALTAPPVALFSSSIGMGAAALYLFTRPNA
jgi:uncharacterized membrane protein YbaN (DUF454 family)